MIDKNEAVSGGSYQSPEAEIIRFDEDSVITTASFDPNDDSGWSSGWV